MTSVILRSVGRWTVGWPEVTWEPGPHRHQGQQVQGSLVTETQRSSLWLMGVCARALARAPQQGLCQFWRWPGALCQVCLELLLCATARGGGVPLAQPGAGAPRRRSPALSPAGLHLPQMRVWLYRGASRRNQVTQPGARWPDRPRGAGGAVAGTRGAAPNAGSVLDGPWRAGGGCWGVGLHFPTWGPGRASEGHRGPESCWDPPGADLPPSSQEYRKWVRPLHGSPRPEQAVI